MELLIVLIGTATDPTGAVTSDVSIVGANLQTNVSHESKTDSSGNYSIPFLPAGDYSVSASIASFQTMRTEEVTLQVGQTARLNFELRLGDVSERVTVEANAVLLQTENSAVGAVISIRHLPLNGRTFVQLAQLVPGVQPVTPFSRSVGSLEEFKVETSTTSAEFGGAPGGQVSIVTKRGTNEFHGTLWEFNRNDALTQSYDVIAGKEVTPPRLNRNQFGATIGGPLTISKLYNTRERIALFSSLTGNRANRYSPPCNRPAWYPRHRSAKAISEDY